MIGGAHHHQTEARRLVWDAIVNEETFQSKCRVVAGEVAKDFPGVEPEDVLNGLLLKRTGHPNVPFDFLIDDAHQICETIRSVSVQYDYRPTEVLSILDYIYEDGESFSVEVADVKWALEGLHWADRALIESKYKYGEEVLEHYREALERAVERLTDRLNSYSRGRYTKGLR